MKKLILAFIISLFLGAMTLGFAEDTIKKLESPPIITPVTEKKPILRVPELKEIPIITFIPEEKPTLEIPRLEPPATVTPVQEPQPRYEPLAFREMPAVQGVKEVDFQWLKIDKFIGGRNLESFETQLALDEALASNNVQWTKTGMLIKRKGCHRENGATHPVLPEGSKIQGLYRFYRESGATYLLAGSQDSVFRVYEDSVKHVTHGFATSPGDAWFDMTTFKDRVIIVKENSPPQYSLGTGNPAYMGDYHPLGAWAMQPDTFYMVTDTQWVNVCYWYDDYRECSDERRITELSTLLLRFNNGIFEQDEFVGFYIHFGDISPAKPHAWGKIIKNSKTDIYVIGTGATSGDLSTFCDGSNFMGAYYRTALVDGGRIDSVQTDQANHLQRLFGDFDSAPADWEDNYAFTPGQHPYIVVKVGTAMNRLIWEWEAGSAGDQDTLYVDLYNPWDEELGKTDSTCRFNANDSVVIYRASFYQPYLVKIWDNRVWLVGDSGVYNRLQYSETGTMNDFKWNNFINIPFGEKSKITGLATYYNDPFGYKETSKNELIVFTENHTYKVRKTSEGGFAVIDFIDGIGCVAPKSIKTIEGKYIIFLDKNGLEGIDPNGLILPRFSTKINKFFQETINRSYMHLSAGGYDSRTNHYYLSCPTGSSTKNDTTLILNLDFGCFSGADIKAGLWTEQLGYEDTVNLVFADNDSGWIFNFGYVEYDINAGDHPIATYQLPLLGNEDPHLRKKFRLVELEFYVDCDTGSPALYLDFYIDKSDSLVFSDTISFTANYSGNCFSKVYLDSDKTFGRSLSMKIRTSVAIEKFWLSHCSFKFVEDSEF